MHHRLLFTLTSCVSGCVWVFLYYYFFYVNVCVHQTSFETHGCLILKLCAQMRGVWHCEFGVQRAHRLA